MVVRLEAGMYIEGLKQFQSLIDRSAFVEDCSDGAEDNKVRLAFILMCLIEVQLQDPGAYTFLIHSVYNKIRSRYHNKPAQR